MRLVSFFFMDGVITHKKFLETNDSEAYARRPPAGSAAAASKKLCKTTYNKIIFLLYPSFYKN